MDEIDLPAIAPYLNQPLVFCAFTMVVVAFVLSKLLKPRFLRNLGPRMRNAAVMLPLVTLLLIPISQLLPRMYQAVRNDVSSLRGTAAVIVANSSCNHVGSLEDGGDDQMLSGDSGTDRLSEDHSDDKMYFGQDRGIFFGQRHGDLLLGNADNDEFLEDAQNTATAVALFCQPKRRSSE